MASFILEKGTDTEVFPTREAFCMRMSKSAIGSFTI